MNEIESNGEDIERKAPKTKKYRWIKWNIKTIFLTRCTLNSMHERVSFSKLKMIIEFFVRLNYVTDRSLNEELIAKSNWILAKWIRKQFEIFEKWAAIAKTKKYKCWKQIQVNRVQFNLWNSPEDYVINHPVLS